eukprot:9170153-Alexandrium_andersonii.AAC.1
MGNWGLTLLRWPGQPGAPLIVFLPWEANQELVSGESLSELRRRVEASECAGRFGSGRWFEDDGSDPDI